MCGVVGIIGREAQAEAVQRMAAYIVHRGPDDFGFHCAAKVALGMRRLAIIDRAHGRQPIYNETRDVAIVYNGEVYNHAELRLELEAKGHRFQSASDTEVLVHGYEEWGEDGLLNRLNGMFAFAIHDRRAGRVFMARDRMGVKPFYYTQAGGALWFASEVKAFKAIPDISFEIDAEIVPTWLRLRYVPAPRTLFRGIFKLPAGHCMSMAEDGGDPQIRRWWIPCVQPVTLSDADCVERYGELFEDAVRIRLMSEVPVGAYLSEGLDSNLVAWAMARHSPSRVSTYSMGFGGPQDETPAARKSARKLGLDHHEVMFGDGDFSDLAAVIWHLDEPIGDAHVLPSYILARETKRSLTVVLLGEGADESLYGYPFHKISRLIRQLTRPFPPAMTEALMPALARAMPLGALNAIFPLPTSLGADGKRHLEAFLAAAPRGSGAELFTLLSSLFHSHELERLCTMPVAAPVLAPSLFRSDPDDRSPDGALRQIHDAQFSGWLQDNILLRHDKTAMAHAVECRVPFLDYRLVEFLAGVPTRLKVSGWKDKILSRRYGAAPHRLGAEIAWRPKKPFFLPLERFVASPAFAALVADNLSDHRLLRRNLFRREEVHALIARATPDNFLAVKRVMSLIILELWQRIFIDDEFSFAPSRTEIKGLVP